MKKSLFIVLVMCLVLVGCGKESGEKKFCTEVRSLIAKTRDNITRENWGKLVSDVNALYDKYCESSSVCDKVKSGIKENDYDMSYNSYISMMYSEQEAIKNTSDSLSGQLGFVDMDCQKALDE